MLFPRREARPAVREPWRRWPVTSRCLAAPRRCLRSTNDREGPFSRILEIATKSASEPIATGFPAIFWKTEKVLRRRTTSKCRRTPSPEGRRGVCRVGVAFVQGTRTQGRSVESAGITGDAGQASGCGTRRRRAGSSVRRKAMALCPQAGPRHVFPCLFNMTIEADRGPTAPASPPLRMSRQCRDKHASH